MSKVDRDEDGVFDKHQRLLRIASKLSRRPLHMDVYQTMLTGAQRLFGVIHARQIRDRSRSAPNFNVFAITDRGRFEVTTHSRIIGHLLDPNGAHGQGVLFLRPFLRLVRRSSGIRLPRADHRWRVVLEQNHIDISLKHPAGCVIIENKWEHGDRPGQLLDYWREELDRSGLPRIPAVYLAPHFNGPDLGEDSYLYRAIKRDLVVITYQKQLVPLLRRVLSRVRARRVEETLRQYLEVVDAEAKGPG